MYTHACSLEWKYFILNKKETFKFSCNFTVHKAARQLEEQEDTVKTPGHPPPNGLGRRTHWARLKPGSGAATVTVDISKMPETKWEHR